MKFTTERETPSVDGLVIAILGGTGEQGRGLARRFAMAGHPVIIGSRSHHRAHAVAREIGHDVRGQANRDAAREADLVITAVPCAGHGELLAGLAPELAGCGSPTFRPVIPDEPGPCRGGPASPPTTAPRPALLARYAS